MQTILNELFDRYNRFVPDAEPLQEVENAHQQLHLSLPKGNALVAQLFDEGRGFGRGCSWHKRAKSVTSWHKNAASLPGSEAA